MERVVVVAHPRREFPRELARRLAGDGYDVVPTTTAQGALNACCALEPDGVVIALNLPNPGPIWLVTQVRGAGDRLSTVPMLAVAPDTSNPNMPTAIQALRGGMDRCLPSDALPRDVALQLVALIQMVARLKAGRRRRRSLVSVAELPEAKLGYLHGDLGKFSAASVMMALEMEQRSGTLVLHDAVTGARTSLGFASGALCSSAIDGDPVELVEAVGMVLTWQGRFEFCSGLAETVTRPTPVGRLIMEAIWRNDQATPPKPPATRKASGTRQRVVTPTERVAFSRDAPPRPRRKAVITMENQPAPAADDDSTTVEWSFGRR